MGLCNRLNNDDAKTNALLLFAAHRRHVPLELARRQTSTSVDHLKPRAAAVGRKIDANRCTVFPIDAACSGFCRIFKNIQNRKSQLKFVSPDLYLHGLDARRHSQPTRTPQIRSGCFH